MPLQGNRSVAVPRWIPGDRARRRSSVSGNFTAAAVGALKRSGSGDFTMTGRNLQQQWGLYSTGRGSSRQQQKELNISRVNFIITVGLLDSGNFTAALKTSQAVGTFGQQMELLEQWMRTVQQQRGLLGSSGNLTAVAMETSATAAVGALQQQ